MLDTTHATLAVQRLDETTTDRWDAFVTACPTATFFHRAGWRTAIEGALGHRCHFLYAEAHGEIRGVLPLVEVKSRLFGHALISSAFCVYGGPAASDAAAQAALDVAALELARSLGVDHLEYRLLRPMHDDWSRDSETYATFRKELDPDPERNMLAVPRKQRAMIRKGIKTGLLAERDTSVQRFFPIYAESVRNLGTPVLPRRYFQALMDSFGEACEVTTVSHEGKPVSSVLSFYFRDQVLPYYGGGEPAARALAAFDFMYWQVMRSACERGYRLYDFGRSKAGTGSFEFKTHWGFRPEPLHYEYHLPQGGERPSINPLNPKYRLMIATWKRLPLPVANFLGPHIARQIG